MVHYGTFTARNPVTAAHYGLASYSLWVHYHDAYRWGAARRVAGWLVRTEHANRKWKYSFPEPAPGSSETLAPGWGSALAQGQALSLLGRGYRHTHATKYLRAIQSGLTALTRPVSRGGFRTRVWRRHSLREYPTK